VQVQNYDRSGSWARDRGSWSHNRDGDYRQRQGDQSQYRDRTRWASGSWDRNWRNDRRYDWRRYRDSHRSVFHLGIYYDPFGYRYQPFNIGYRLSPVYFGENYWIDPGLYGLPYPPPGAQWVRYWNDAVLVDMYSGEVIDVIRDFFW
jgi:Ni/Co efflux regulator RcnB